MSVPWYRCSRRYAEYDITTSRTKLFSLSYRRVRGRDHRGVAIVGNPAVEVGSSDTRPIPFRYPPRFGGVPPNGSHRIYVLGSIDIASNPRIAGLEDGPGIPEADRDTVFDSGYSTAAEGTGVGLAIVQQVVDAHGWTVTVTESEAGGTRFEITGVERESRAPTPN
jgi:hypothetical protein